MQITSSRLNHTAKAPATAPSDSTESVTFLNEPHVPMDAVMRGYSQLDSSKLKDVFSYAAIGAAGGAAAGALSGGSGWMVPASMGTSAVAATAGTFLDLKINGDDGYGRLALLVSPIAGGGVGLAGGLVGFGLTALTGMNPVASGAVGGAVSGATIALFS